MTANRNSFAWTGTLDTPVRKHTIYASAVDGDRKMKKKKIGKFTQQVINLCDCQQNTERTSEKKQKKNEFVVQTGQ